MREHFFVFNNLGGWVLQKINNKIKRENGGSEFPEDGNGVIEERKQPMHELQNSWGVDSLFFQTKPYPQNQVAAAAELEKNHQLPLPAATAAHNQDENDRDNSSSSNNDDDDEDDDEATFSPETCRLVNQFSKLLSPRRSVRCELDMNAEQELDDSSSSYYYQSKFEPIFESTVSVWFSNPIIDGKNINTTA